MQRTIRIVEFLAAAIIVMVLGGLGGWYFFIDQQVGETAQTDTARGFGSNLSFGEPGASVRPSADQPLLLGTSTVERRAPRLWRITPGPVSGFGFRSASSSIYYVERGNGNIMIADPETSQVLRLTNTLVPKVYEALFTTGGSVLLRSIAENGSVATFSGEAVATSSSAKTSIRSLSGSYLPADIVSIAVSGDTLYYVVRDPEGGSVIVASSVRGTNQRKVLELPLSQWTVDSANDGSVLLAQKPADNVVGYAYTLSASGSLTRIALGPGLIAHPKTAGGPLLYSTSAGGLALFARAGAEATAVRLPIATTADKCAWTRGSEPIAYCAVPIGNPGAGYLDRRAKGAAHTTDQWWRVDVAAGTADVFFSFPTGTSVDVMRPQIDERSGTLVFMNAIDGSLWSLRLAAE